MQPTSITLSLIGIRPKDVVRSEGWRWAVATAANEILQALFQQNNQLESLNDGELTARAGVLTVFSNLIDSFVSHETQIEHFDDVSREWRIRRPELLSRCSNDRVDQIAVESDRFTSSLFRAAQHNDNATHLFNTMKAMCLALCDYANAETGPTLEYLKTADAFEELVHSLAPNR